MINRSFCSEEVVTKAGGPSRIWKKTGTSLARKVASEFEAHHVSMLSRTSLARPIFSLMSVISR